MSQVLLVVEESRVDWFYANLPQVLPENTEVTVAYDDGEAKDFLSPEESDICLVVVGIFPGRTAHTFGGPNLIRDMRRVGHTFSIVVVSGSPQYNREALDAGANHESNLQSFKSSMRPVVVKAFGLSR